MQSVVATSFFLVDGWTCVQSVGHFVGFWTTVCKTVRPIGSLHCLSVALVYCSQTVGWIKMPLDTEVGLGSGDIVLDGDPAPPTEKGTVARPHFRPMSIVAKRSPISATAALLFGVATVNIFSSVNRMMLTSLGGFFSNCFGRLGLAL